MAYPKRYRGISSTCSVSDLRLIRSFRAHHVSGTRSCTFAHVPRHGMSMSTALSARARVCSSRQRMACSSFETSSIYAMLLHLGLMCNATAVRLLRRRAVLANRLKRIPHRSCRHQSAVPSDCAPAPASLRASRRPAWASQRAANVARLHC